MVSQPDKGLLVLNGMVNLRKSTNLVSYLAQAGLERTVFIHSTERVVGHVFWSWPGRPDGSGSTYVLAYDSRA